MLRLHIAQDGRKTNKHPKSPPMLFTVFKMQSKKRWQLRLFNQGCPLKFNMMWNVVFAVLWYCFLGFCHFLYQCNRSHRTSEGICVKVTGMEPCEFSSFQSKVSK